MSDGTPARDPSCRVCFDCHGAHHHWMEDFDDDAQWEHSPEPMPVWGCKHCDFTMPYCMDGFDSEEPDEMFAYLMRVEHEVPHATEPGGCLYTLPLFSEDDLDFGPDPDDDEVPHA